MGRSHTNPILNTRMYQIKFDGDEVTELTTNVISESMYAQCDADGNKYYVLVNYQKDNKDIFIIDGQMTVLGRPVTCKSPAGWQICCQ